MKLFALNLLACLGMLMTPVIAMASSSSLSLDLTSHWVGFVALAIFVCAYLFVIFEEVIHLRKSKPVLVAAGVIWVLIAVAYQQQGDNEAVQIAIRHNFLEYAELFFFLLVAMTFINAMIERKVFDALRHWLVSQGFSYRLLFILTGVVAFHLSPIADNLTTALVMCAVVMAVGKGQPKFILLGCINIVVAANAGGAFSPFGDITTLMVWQKGIIEFGTFFKLMVPAYVNFLVPALIMYFAVPHGKPEASVSAVSNSAVSNSGMVHENAIKAMDMIKPGGLPIVGLFFATIVTAVCFHNFLHIPPVFGMMAGLAYLKIYGFFLRARYRGHHVHSVEHPPHGAASEEGSGEDKVFDIFNKIAQAEWDTLFFFYGVIMAVGGLGFIGYLAFASEFMYVELGPTTANILVGILSAIVDNIPVMFAVLTMKPAMNETQWLLVTLTAGVGGSLLSVGSAAGVALMGQARGLYTFFGHLKWTPVIALGYAASILVHLWMHG